MFIKRLWVFILLTTCTFYGCNSKTFGTSNDSIDIRMNRFDAALFRWIDSGAGADKSLLLQEIIDEYPQLLGLLGKTLFQTNIIDSTEFFARMETYYSEPTLKSLYSDALALYSTHSPVVELVEKELSRGFIGLKTLFPAMQLPAVYVHISGLQQNMIVADSLLSISIDRYMGADYPLYKNFFYDYQCKNMAPERLAIDGLYAWLMSEFPFKDNEGALLERMIYEGKIAYVLTQIGNDYSAQKISSLTESEYQWCQKHEAAIWKTLIERKHLYATEAITVSRYFQSAPSTFIAADAPGNIGNFTGYQIVSRYMKQTKSSCKDLIINNNAQEILKKSKYKP